MNINSETVTISRSDYECMTARLEDLGDIVAAYEGMASGSGQPSKYALQIVENDEHSIKVWRDYRNMKQSELAKASGISVAYISEIETGKNQVSVEDFRAIAEALNTTIDVLAV